MVTMVHAFQLVTKLYFFVFYVIIHEIELLSKQQLDYGHLRNSNLDIILKIL